MYKFNFLLLYFLSASFHISILMCILFFFLLSYTLMHNVMKYAAQLMKTYLITSWQYNK